MWGWPSSEVLHGLSSYKKIRRMQQAAIAFNLFICNTFLYMCCFLYSLHFIVKITFHIFHSLQSILCIKFHAYPLICIYHIIHHILVNLHCCMLFEWCQISLFFSFKALVLGVILHALYFYASIVRLGPSPKLKLKLKGLDQSRTLNSHSATTTTHPPTTNISI